MTPAQIIARALPTARILWAALTFSNVLLGVVTFVQPGGGKLEPMVVMVLYAYALASAIASFVLPMVASASATRKARAQVVETGAGPDGRPLPARFADPPAAARRALALGQTALIVGMALSESVSLIGLVLHMVGGASMTVSSSLIAAGTLLAAYRFPTPARLVGSYERAHQASFAAEAVA